MANETTTTAASTSVGEGKNTAAEAGGKTATQTAGTETAQTAAEKAFTQADIDRIVKERLADEKRRAEKAAEEKKLADQGEYQKLLEAQKAEAADLKAQLAARDHRDLQRKVAADLKLPPGQAERLRGDDEAALIADGKAVLKELQEAFAPADTKRLPANPANPARNGGGLATDKLQVPSWGSVFKT